MLRKVKGNGACKPEVTLWSMTSLFLALSASFSPIFTKNLKIRMFYAIDMTMKPMGFWHKNTPQGAF